MNGIDARIGDWMDLRGVKWIGIEVVSGVLSFKILQVFVVVPRKGIQVT